MRGASGEVSAVGSFGSAAVESELRYGAAMCLHLQSLIGRTDLSDMASPEVVAKFVVYTRERLAAVEATSRMAELVLQLYARWKAAESRSALAIARHADVVGEVDQFAASSRRLMFELGQLYRLRQGQVEVPLANRGLSNAFDGAILTSTDRIHQMNTLVQKSAAEVAQLIRNTFARRKRIHRYEWEIEFLDFCAATLEMELRHLHTLRVTRQIQDFVANDQHSGNNGVRAKLSREAVNTNVSSRLAVADVVSSADRGNWRLEADQVRSQMDYHREVAARKQSQRSGVIAKLKRQIRDRRYENRMLESEVDRAVEDITDRRAVYSLQHAKSTGILGDARMREIRDSRLLEDIAREQQEEMIRLKQEVDRLRERTYPSFAVVSKHRIG